MKKYKQNETNNQKQKEFNQKKNTREENKKQIKASAKSYNDIMSPIRKEEKRRNSKNRAHWILVEIQKSDKNRNFSSSILQERTNTIKIDCGCSYCEATHIKMSIDRIDNNLGHTNENTVPSCLFCNIFRGNVDYKIWLQIIPYFKCLLGGMFPVWTSGNIQIHQPMFLEERNKNRKRKT